MKKNVIVSLADANYFPLLEELINSIKQFKDSESVAICILDAGLTEQQKEKLSNKVDVCGIERCVPKQSIISAEKIALFPPRWPLIPMIPRLRGWELANKSDAVHVVTNGKLWRSTNSRITSPQAAKRTP